MEAGTKLGHYEILDRLGAGGMGQVYRARDTSLDRDVAIKVLPEDLSADPSWRARFEREAKLLASLNHPNIATVYGFDESNDVRYIAMELVEGESLAQRLERGPLPFAEAILVCGQIAYGLDAAHLAGVIHRDLKPGNVMLASDGNARLVDFGIARAAAPSAEAIPATSAETDLTQTGILLGTVPYMSPEQVRGGAIDARADVWALGCTLYECLTGRRPFAGATGVGNPQRRAGLVCATERHSGRREAAPPAHACEGRQRASALGR